MAGAQSFSFSRLQPCLAEYCARRPEIVAAYLFGSAARGHAGPLSDLDLALLLDERRPRLPRSLAYQAARLSDLIRLLGTNAVDLVLLPAPSPLLQHRILRDKRLLFCRDDRQRLAFEVRAMQTYLDLKPVYDTQTRLFFEHIRAGQFGQIPQHG